MIPRDNKTAFDYGFGVEDKLVKEHGPDYRQMVETLNQSKFPPHGVLEYLLREANRDLGRQPYGRSGLCTSQNR